MKLYIYPQNLKATANLWLWSLRDFALICVGLLLSLVALTQMGILLPLALTAAFAFLSIRMEDLTVLDYEENRVSFDHFRPGHRRGRQRLLAGALLY